MSKRLVILVYVLIFMGCAKDRTEPIPRIDRSLIENSDLIWDLEALQEMPKFRYLDSTSNVREIMFSGIDHQGRSTQVFAYYSNPDILKYGKNKGNKFPGVVLISGGNQPAFKIWVERWAHEGYAVITCDYGNTRMSEACGPVYKNLEEQLKGIYDNIKQGPQAVRAYRTASSAILAHTLLLGFPEVIKDQTAVTGISWGGFQTCLVSGIDNRFKAAASVYGSAFHDEIALDRAYFDNLSPKDKARWMDKIDPKNYIVYSQCPMLFITGNTDGCFDIVPFDKTTQLIPTENRNIKITPNMMHDHPDGWRPREIAVFFNSIFKGGVPLSKITQVEKKESGITFGFNSRTSIKKAWFYYTNDTISTNEKRLWESVPATVYKDRVVSPKPKEGYVMGFLYMEDAMDLGTSSGLIYN